MKTTILANGTLSISPETELEAFALNCWGKENITPDWYAATTSPMKIIIDLSEYAEKLNLFLVAGGVTR